MMLFRDRIEAGQLLAKILSKYRESEPVILALPRGGVIVAAEVARCLHSPLELVIVRKVGHPQNPEFAVCAVTEHGTLACNELALRQIDNDWLEAEIQNQLIEAARRHQRYLAGHETVPVTGKTAILVDDGAATGLTMIAAIADLKEQKPGQIIAAAAVMPHVVAEQLKAYADDVVAVTIPDEFAGAVGAYYERFDQVEDDEVVRALNEARVRTGGVDDGADLTEPN